MKTSKPSAPLVSKLILLVLTLILGCLVYFVFQKSDIVRARAGKAPASSGDAAPPPEPTDAIVEAEPLSKPTTNAASNRLVQARRSLPVANSQPSPALTTTNQTEIDEQPSEIKASMFVQAAVAVPEARAGFFTGRVFLRGTPPPEKVIPWDPVCGRFHAEPVTTRFYLVSKDGALADVFVYIKEGAPTDLGPLPSGSPVLDNIGCLFEPYVFGLRTGQRLRIKNSDPFLHNVHVTSHNNKEFNIGVFSYSNGGLSGFNQPEIFITLKCDVHPWMFAYACVVEHPWFAVTDKDGVFQIPNLPPGTYTLAAVHRKAGELTREIVISDEVSEPITFTFELSPAGKQIADAQSARRESL